MSESQTTIEDWKPIPGYEGLYVVSSYGRVMRVGNAAVQGKGRGGGARVGHIRKLFLRKDGYLGVQLWKNGALEMWLVHRLVARAFLGEPPVKHEVNHKDGNKQNNSHENLEYLTRSENTKHAYRIGLKRPAWLGKPSPRRKPRVTVACACGCQELFVSPDSKGRARRFVSGHNLYPSSKGLYHG